MKKVNHLGCVLEENNSMKTDILSKRSQFIARVNSLIQELHFVDSSIMVGLIRTYATSFYGSGLWDLCSNECSKFYDSWSVAMRNVLNIDRRTHRHLIVPMSRSIHLKTMLLSRYVKFYHSLVNSPKFSVRFVSRLFENDRRTVLGRTISYLCRECGLNRSSDLDKLTPGLVKQHVGFGLIPENGQWMASVASEFLHARDSGYSLDGFSKDEIDEMLEYVCTS